MLLCWCKVDVRFDVLLDVLLDDDPSKFRVSTQPQLTVLPHAYQDVGALVYGCCMTYMLF